MCLKKLRIKATGFSKAQSLPRTLMGGLCCFDTQESQQAMTEAANDDHPKMYFNSTPKQQISTTNER